MSVICALHRTQLSSSLLSACMTCEEGRGKERKGWSVRLNTCALHVFSAPAPESQASIYITFHLVIGHRVSGGREPPSPSALGEILCYHERRFPPPCSLGGHGVVVKSVQYMQHRKGLRRVLLLLEQLGCNPVCDTTVLPYETEGNRPGTQLRRCVHAGVCALPCAGMLHTYSE